MVTMIVVRGSSGIAVSGQLTAGDLIVGVGTLLLALFTWRLAVFTSRLAKETVALDRRGALRERARRERQVRGVARLVSGELGVVHGSIEGSVEDGTWQFWYPLPRGAWDRDGALIAETVEESIAVDLISTFSRLGALQGVLADHQAASPDDRTWEFKSESDDLSDFVTNLLPQIKRAQQHLDALAYPDAQELTPDPDTESSTG